MLSCLVISDSLWPHRLQPARLLCPWGFSRQEYWSGFPCPPPGNLPDPGIEPRSPALQVDSFTIWATREAHDKPSQYIKKQRHHISNNVHMVKAMVFPIVMYGCESWTMKKAEHWRFDAFKRWCWRRLLRVSWTARRANQSILKEINPEYSMEGLLLKL